MPTTDRLTLRRLGPDDLDEVCGLLEESDVATVGFVDFTRDEIAADLGPAGRTAYGWYDEDGTLQAYGWVDPSEGSNQVEIDVYLRPTYDAELGHHALAVLETQGRELAARSGHDEPWFGVGVYRADARTRGWLETAGYAVDTTFTRMRIDLDDESLATAPPTDVVVREVTSEADLRTVHELEEDSFTEHYGHVASSYERWYERLTKFGPGYARVFLADLDGEPVGVMVTTKQFEQDEDAGYVRTLGVVPAGRGRGVAKALLRHCFADSRGAGRKAVLLHVDVANVTGALRLYEAVGMRCVLEIDAYAKGRLVR